MLNKDTIAAAFSELQADICRRLEVADGSGEFGKDHWERQEGGGGLTRVLKNGKHIEKGGVAFSKVFGPVSDVMRRQLSLDGETFFATGVSIVLHPNSPHVPIIHMNVRYFEAGDTFWFGGGIDLTPHFIIPGHAALFHRSLKSVCDRFDQEYYPAFKKWADDYFYIPHRNETRGVGGIFFDHQQGDKQKLFDFCVALGTAFPDIYATQIELGKDREISVEDRQWQHIRRGRYVEFNLVHDRGTKFGLLSGGRTESILMSLPPEASWEYCFDESAIPGATSTLDQLKKDIDWLKC